MPGGLGFIRTLIVSDSNSRLLLTRKSQHAETIYSGVSIQKISNWCTKSAIDATEAHNYITTFILSYAYPMSPQTLYALSRYKSYFKSKRKQPGDTIKL